MTTKTEICNLALMRIGSTTVGNIDTENSAEANACRQFYDVARRATLRGHRWNFATKRSNLARLPDDSVEDWNYVYQYPSDCLAIRSILTVPRNQDPIEYEVANIDGNRVILTDEQGARIIYTTDVVDAVLYDDTFINALSYRLAMEVSGPLTASSGLREQMLNLYLNELESARGEDSSEGMPDEGRDANWIEAELGGTPPPLNVRLTNNGGN